MPNCIWATNKQRRVLEFLQVAIGHIDISRLFPEVLPPEVLVFANSDEPLGSLQQTPEDVSIVFHRKNRAGIDIWKRSLSAFSKFGYNEGVSRCLAEIYQRKLRLLEAALKTTKLAEVAHDRDSTAVRVMLEENVDPNSMSGDTATMNFLTNDFCRRDERHATYIYMICFERG